jgi:hypothetical protein
VLIEQEILDKLGAQPGWWALQFLVEDHVRIFFVPPEHNRSLLGALKPYIRREPLPEDAWDEIVAQAIAMEFASKSDAE